MDITKTPPQAIEIEARLLGELLSFPDAMDTVEPILTAHDFYTDNHRQVFFAIRELWSNGKNIDIIAVTEQLRKMQQLDNVGGAFGVTKLTSAVITDKHIADHAYFIKERSVKRELIRYGTELERSSYDESKDLADIMDQAQSGLNKITDQVHGNSEKTFPEILNATINQYFESKQKAGKNEFTGIKTPVLKLTKLTGGWQPGDLIIIAGRPSMGKTALAIQTAVTAANYGSAVDVYTIEMQDIPIARRIICCATGIDPEQLRNGQLSEKDEKMMEKAVNDLMKYKINIDDKSGITAEYVRAKSSANHRRGKCDMIIIDYLQLMNFDHKMNKNDGYGSITRKMKELAKELNVPVIVLAQLNREVERRSERRPGLADLRDSGEIEQDADIVLFPFRPHYYSDDEDPTLIELNVVKHRNGRTASINARHNESITQIFDDAPEYATEPAPF